MKTFNSLDPVVLLGRLEECQTEFWSTSVPAPESASVAMLRRFIKATAPEPKNETPTKESRRQRKRVWMPTAAYPGAKKGKKTTLDEVWDEVCIELAGKPDITAREVLALLESRYPGIFRTTQTSTMSDKIKVWRYQRGMSLEFRKLKPGRKTNIDEVWVLALEVLKQQPNISGNGLHRYLLEKYPGQVTPGQRTSIMDRARVWRRENQHLPLPTECQPAISIFEDALSLVSQLASV